MTEPKHEVKDVNVRVVIAFAFGLVLTVLITFGIVHGIFQYFASTEAKVTPPPPPMFETNRLPAEPRLQINPRRDLQQMRAMEDTILHSYGWVDTNAGIVRIRGIL